VLFSYTFSKQVCHNQVPVGTRWCPLCHTNLFNPEVRLASPGKRLGAYVFDVLIPLVAFWIIVCGGGGLVSGLASAFSETGGSDTAAGVVGLGMLVMLLGFAAYVFWALWLFARGTTPGKMLLGMYVAKEDGNRADFGTMLVREVIGKFLSSLIFFIGFLSIILDKEWRGWHDKLANTFVVEKYPS